MMGTHVQEVVDGAVPAADARRPIVYDPVFDEYQLTTIAWPHGSVVLFFCPWCGHGLPASKRDRWYDALDAAGTSPDSPHLDERFRSNAWWDGPCLE
jgi:hypothetical protein